MDLTRLQKIRESKENAEGLCLRLSAAKMRARDELQRAYEYHRTVASGRFENQSAALARAAAALAAAPQKLKDAQAAATAANAKYDGHLRLWEQLMKQLPPNLRDGGVEHVSRDGSIPIIGGVL